MKHSVSCCFLHSATWMISQVMLLLMLWSPCLTSHFGNLDPKRGLASFAPYKTVNTCTNKMRIFPNLPNWIQMSIFVENVRMAAASCRLANVTDSCVMDVTAAVWREVVHGLGRGGPGRRRGEKGITCHQLIKRRRGTKLGRLPGAFISCAAGNYLRRSADSRRSYPASISQVFYY